MIGLSLSCCVRDICAGRVDMDEVEVVIAGTMLETPAQIAEALDHYQHIYWYDFPQATEIALHLFETGRVEQPRLENPQHYPNISEGHWVTSRSDIRWQGGR